MIAPRDLSLSEADFKNSILRLAKQHGWMAHHVKPSRRNGAWASWQDGDNGFPDLVLARAGDTPIFVELKTTKGVVSNAQKMWARELGELYEIWTPEDWFAIAERLQRFAGV